ncbi:MraY family glycosyltransferase [Dysosmobacter sp.]|uniref:MraY family glycosyltransferase n=1 Tax=Dysosmobacter sp. TaxID=2591382 RepID=UPI002A9F3DD7|nr:MraY family glycosyltransferase [Dysosmobacter sp.]MDY5612255.1 MraY family glycosyltransferase [Dysosmobacter sp.]
MLIENRLVAYVVLALLVALVVSFLMTPVVKTFAYKVGAIDVPKDNRRMHKVPIPRLGGLAIFIGFMVSILLFAEISAEMKSILLGAVIIVVLGVVDDIMALPAMLKFVVQIAAALIPALNGVQILAFSNPNIFSESLYWVLGGLSVPFTVLWIVAITNAVNLIDGLDGLANGVSAISATTMLVIALVGGQTQVSIVLAALVGACVGFMPYNMNPAKMFMGDTGATFLGFILATMSIQGLFKYYAVVSFVVPFLILGLPIFDTAFAFIRRVAHGQSPMHADRSHIHHRLIDMGLNQKQAVATLYVISAILGLSAVVLTTSGEQKAMLMFAALCIVGAVAARVVFPREVREELKEELEELKDHGHHEEEKPAEGQKDEEG